MHGHEGHQLCVHEYGLQHLGTHPVRFDEIRLRRQAGAAGLRQSSITKVRRLAMSQRGATALRRPSAVSASKVPTPCCSDSTAKLSNRSSCVRLHPEGDPPRIGIETQPIGQGLHDCQ